MDDDERDPDLVAEMHSARRKANAERNRRIAWDEPYFDEEFPCPRCTAMRYIDKPDGCRDYDCP